MARRAVAPFSCFEIVGLVDRLRRQAAWGCVLYITVAEGQLRYVVTTGVKENRLAAVFLWPSGAAG